MAIKKIQIANFKSFKKLEVDLGRLNVLIGANASGKSNFVQIFHFLRDIVNFGLNNAVSMQGGVEYLRNINVGTSENFSVTVTISDEGFAAVGKRTKEYLIMLKPFLMIYEFVLRFAERGSGFEIIKDKLTQKCNFEKVDKTFKKRENLGEGEIILSRTNGKVNIDLHKAEGVPIEEEEISPPYLAEEELPPTTLILETPFYFKFPIEEILSNISIYDFDPKLPKKATPITGKAELEEDGSNLSIVLKNIIEHRDEKRKLLNLVKDILPFIKDLGVEKFADKSILFKLREIYSGKKDLPASSISDGTINITALIISLYFGKKGFTIIEEPERNIHPYLISKVIDLMKDASQKKQIVATTHNPEIVKSADLENILLVSRDKEGFSTISKPGEKEEVKTFLKNEIGIEELFVQDLLGT